MAADSPVRASSGGSPARGGLIDRLTFAALVLGVLLIAIDVVWTFTLAPMVQGAELSEPAIIGGTQVTTKLLLSQKIFYLHVPVAVASFVVMFFAALWAVRFLMTKDRAFDLRSKTAMEVTLAFIVATMISGDLWTRFEWGVWWVWEPRLTTYFILMLLVMVVFRTDSGLPPMMLIPFLLGLFGMLFIAFALTRLALRINADAQEVEDLKERLEEQDAWKSRAAAGAALERLRAGAREAVAADEAPARADSPDASTTGAATGAAADGAGVSTTAHAEVAPADTESPDTHLDSSQEA